MEIKTTFEKQADGSIAEKRQATLDGLPIDGTLPL